jgi:integrase
MTSRHGEGTVWFNAERGLWFGQVCLGPGNRPRVSSKSKSVMLKKMRALHDLPSSKQERFTVSDWLDQWLGEIMPRRVSESTLESYTNWASWYVKPHVGHIGLAELCVDDVEGMMLTLERAGLAPRTVSQARNLLKRGLAAAKKRGKVLTNVAEDADAPRIKGAKTHDRLNADQAQAVLKVLLHDRLYCLAVMALWLGLRPGELYGLRWSQVDLDGRIVHVNANLKRRKDGDWYLKSTKTTASERDSVPLPPFVVTSLRAHREAQEAEHSRGQHGFVFTTLDGEPLHQREVLRWWHDATIRAGVGRRRFYCTRHTCATLLLRNGVPLEVVSKILRHSGLAITADIYAEVSDEMQRQAIEKMDGILGF